VKLFLKIFNLCDHNTSTSQTGRHRDDCVASRGKKTVALNCTVFAHCGHGKQCNGGIWWKKKCI